MGGTCARAKRPGTVTEELRGQRVVDIDRLEGLQSLYDVFSALPDGQREVALSIATLESITRFFLKSPAGTDKVEELHVPMLETGPVDDQKAIETWSVLFEAVRTSNAPLNLLHVS